MCWIKEIFGLDCPGCGGTRMVLALLRLDFYQAFRFNPWCFVMIPTVVISYILLYKRNIHLLLLIVRGAFFATVAFFIIRNLPGFEFMLPTYVYQ